MSAPADQGPLSQRVSGCCGAGGDRDQEQQVAMPPVVSIAEWNRARQQLLIKEKEATRMLDRLAAERRRLPMTRVENNYQFEGPQGLRSLFDLFEGRRQLIVYHFMYAPDWQTPCPGCCRRMDDVGHPAHLNARDTTFAVVARSPYERLAALWSRKGWTMPIWSYGDSNFNADMGIAGDDDFGISVFFRDDSGGVYRSYFTDGRGVEPAGFRALLDMTPYGRQEDWEDSPGGWPQSPTHGWGSERDE
ncbi:MAG TPA: DUF899 domain-containing protein [Vineibacter sp.]|nr:DUF899 domain-containing protein [Vineibacter sp.]